MPEEKKKYRVSWEIVVHVEARDEDEATALADEEWAKGHHVCYPAIVEEE